MQGIDVWDAGACFASNVSFSGLPGQLLIVGPDPSQSFFNSLFQAQKHVLRAFRRADPFVKLQA